MKKLFTLVVIMCMLGVCRVWAGPYFYFIECPQLDYGTTSYNYLTPELLSSPAWTGTHTFSNWQSGKVDITKENFANAAVGDYIKVRATNVGNNANFGLKHFNDYSDIIANLYPEFNGNTEVQTELSSDLYNYIINNGLGIQGSNGEGFTLTSVEIVPNKSSFTWTAVPHGGVTITGGYTANNNGVYTLDKAHPDQFTFSGTGYIVIKCERNNYVASYLITVLEEGQKRHWDFTKHQFVMGPNSGYWRSANDNQWQPDQYSTDEQVIKYKGSINVTMSRYILAETNGGDDKLLWINQDGSDYYNIGYNKLSIRNDGAEFESDHSSNRFVGIEPDVTVKIPNLKAGDRVRILMDKYGSDMELTFSNAKDALGKSITSNYKVGGSSDKENNKDNLKAYYNFIVDHDGEFTFKQTATTCYLMKIYDIEVYTGDFKVDNTINCIKASNMNGYTVTNNYQKSTDWNESTPDTDLFTYDCQFYLHWRGKDEIRHTVEIVTQTGNLDLTPDDYEYAVYTRDSKTYYTNFKLTTSGKNRIRNNNLFGAYKMRIKIWDATNTYVTDYADRIMAFGYIEKVNHPITWDFTDLKTYLDKADCLQKENDYVADDMNVWTKDANGDWCLNYTRSNPDGARFSWGSQLYAGNKMFDETRGIGFAPVNGNMSNTSLKIVDGGLRIEDKDGMTETNYLSRGWELTIHDMDGLAALYMRLEPIEGKTPRVECEYYRSGENGAQGIRYPKKKVFGTNDNVYGCTAGLFWDAADGEQGRGAWKEFKIRLNNVILKKIGTSKDQKMISKPGYATESRRRDIDHSLTSYFTGLPIEAYTGYLPAEGDYSKVVLKRIDNDESHKVLPASTEGVGQSNTGCILYNNVEVTDESKGKNTIDGLDRGIHLFVPDMHDTEKRIDVNDLSGNSSNHKNILLSFKPTYNYFTFNEQDKDNPENYIYKEEGDDLRFILAAKKYKYGTSGSGVETGYDVYFIRIDPNAKRKIAVPTGEKDEWGNEKYNIVTDNDNLGYAYLMQNCAYMRIPKDKVKELTSGSTNGAKMSIVFEDDWFGEINNGIATGIDQVTSNKSQVTSAEWYNLNGQKLNGMPTEKGLYIVNGRKVLVK